MVYLPITLIVALLASLFVAYIINPVFAADFMGVHDHDHSRKKLTKGYLITGVVFAALAVVWYITGSFGLGNFTLFLFGIYSLHRFVLEELISNFQLNHQFVVLLFASHFFSYFVFGINSFMPHTLCTTKRHTKSTT